MDVEKIVIKFKDGSIMKGETTDFVPEKQYFYLELVEHRGTKKIDIQELKAIFFVKDFEGNKDHKKVYKDVLMWGGQKVKAEFSDGEVIIGYSSNFSTGLYGFFMTPADNKGNNERIFIVKSATTSIAFI